MPRPITTFSDDELRAILAAAHEAHARFPDRNAHFLDAFIAGVAIATGRLYGQTTYVRLLGAAGINRRPSAPTWSAAIGRIRVSPLSALPREARPTTDHPATALPATSARTDERENEMAALKVRAQIAEASLADAYRQLRRMETERDDSLRRLAIAEARVGEAEKWRKEVVAEKEAIAATLTERVDALRAAEGRLAGLERHLHLQTDQMRTDLLQQVNHYQSRLEAAEKALDRERSQSDALRRVLSDRGITPAAP